MEASNVRDKASKALEKATFGGGCFWCIEAVFERIPGVQSVVSGYMGGTKPNPSYEEVCTGATGHAEVVQVTYDPEAVSYDQLLDWFWRAHDPTQVNRQGADVGPQYRSVIFYHSDEQRQQAEASRRRLEMSRTYHRPIATVIEPAREFWPAEEYHQDYFRRHLDAIYCRIVIEPKLKKLKLPSPAELSH